MWLHRLTDYIWQSLAYVWECWKPGVYLGLLVSCLIMVQWYRQTDAFELGTVKMYFDAWTTWGDEPVEWRFKGPEGKTYSARAYDSAGHEKTLLRPSELLRLFDLTPPQPMVSLKRWTTLAEVLGVVTLGLYWRFRRYAEECDRRGLPLIDWDKWRGRLVEAGWQTLERLMPSLFEVEPGSQVATGQPPAATPATATACVPVQPLSTPSAPIAKPGPSGNRATGPVTYPVAVQAPAPGAAVAVVRQPAGPAQLPALEQTPRRRRSVPRWEPLIADWDAPVAGSNAGTPLLVDSSKHGKQED